MDILRRSEMKLFVASCMVVSSLALMGCSTNTTASAPEMVAPAAPAPAPLPPPPPPPTPPPAPVPPPVPAPAPAAPAATSGLTQAQTDQAIQLLGRCLNCHNADDIRSQKKTRAEWAGTLSVMAVNANLNDTETALVLDYLAANYHP